MIAITRHDRLLIYLLISVSVISLVSLMIMPAPASGTGTARITVGGRLQAAWELAGPPRREKFATGGGGFCLVEQSGGRIRVRVANCPKHLCVLRGWVTKVGQSVICLPHRLVIDISSGRAGGAKDIDATVR